MENAALDTVTVRDLVLPSVVTVLVKLPNDGFLNNVIVFEIAEEFTCLVVATESVLNRIRPVIVISNVVTSSASTGKASSDTSTT